MCLIKVNIFSFLHIVVASSHADYCALINSGFLLAIQYKGA